MLLQSVGIINIGYSIFQQEMKAVERKQAIANTLGWCVCQTIGLVFTAVLVLWDIVVAQKYFFVFGCYRIDLSCCGETVLSFFTETVVLRISLADSSIKSTNGWSNLIVVIFHVITEHHYLCDVQETSILRIHKTLFHTLCLCLYSLVVVFFLYLYES